MHSTDVYTDRLLSEVHLFIKKHLTIKTCFHVTTCPIHWGAPQPSPDYCGKRPKDPVSPSSTQLEKLVLYILSNVYGGNRPSKTLC
jgi:hypothetical protein